MVLLVLCMYSLAFHSGNYRNGFFDTAKVSARYCMVHICVRDLMQPPQFSGSASFQTITYATKYDPRTVISLVRGCILY